MRSAMHNGIVLTKRERRDRAAVVLGATFISVLAWAFLFYRSWVTQRIDFFAVVMPGIDQWTPADLLMVFAMWAIMMVAMMVPPVTPMLFTFAMISSNRLAQGRAFVPRWVFLAGYLVFWTLLASWPRWRSGDCTALPCFPPPWGAPVPWLAVMGLRHGACCLGSCWLLMAVLFAVGAMNLAWIAGLSVFMLLERILPREFRVAKVAGLILTASGAWMALSAGG
jgi:predicted metal-binding membrane protein